MSGGGDTLAEGAGELTIRAATTPGQLLNLTMRAEYMFVNGLAVVGVVQFRCPLREERTIREHEALDVGDRRGLGGDDLTYQGDVGCPNNPPHPLTRPWPRHSA